MANLAITYLSSTNTSDSFAYQKTRNIKSHFYQMGIICKTNFVWCQNRIYHILQEAEEFFPLVEGEKIDELPRLTTHGGPST